MKTLVTGGAGFIGSHLVEALVKDEHEVVVLDNLVSGKIENLDSVSNKIEIIQLDIRSNDIEYAFHNVDVVYHLAALADIVPSITDPYEYIDVNVMGTARVLEASRASGVERIIYAASSSCYGIPERYPTEESEKCDPKYPYALSKFLGEQIFLHWINLYKIQGLSLRLFNVYGPRARTNGSYGAVMGVFLGQKYSGLPFTIVGDGNQKRDFTYVTDVADAFIKAGDSTISNRIINIGTSKPISVNYLADLLEGDRDYIPKRPGEPDVTHASITRAVQELGWKPTIQIEDGIKKVLDGYSAWKDAPTWTREQIQVQTQDWFRYLGNN